MAVRKRKRAGIESYQAKKIRVPAVFSFCPPLFIQLSFISDQIIKNDRIHIDLSIYDFSLKTLHANQVNMTRLSFYR
jgi:hypothetical protein